MKKVASAPLDMDLSELSRWLIMHGVPHRIAEQDGAQCIFMPDERYQSEIQDVLDRYIRESSFRVEINEQVSKVRFVPRKSAAAYPRATPSQAPVMYVMIGLSILIAYLTNLGKGGEILRHLLIINPFLLEGAPLNTAAERLSGLAEMLALGHIWRVFTPDFLHFSMMHIVFNVLMLWTLGGQLEIRRGSVAFLAMAMFVSVVSNIAQLIDSGYLFGGLSGVVYGLVGYCWVWRRVSSDIFLPTPLFRFSIIWLLIGYTPLTEWLGLGRMANSAHLYGLLSGLLWGWITTHYFRVEPISSKDSNGKTPKA